MSDAVRDRSELNARLQELSRETAFSQDDWTEAAMYLGDSAEALLPTVEALVATGLHGPLRAASYAHAALYDPIRPLHP